MRRRLEEEDVELVRVRCLTLDAAREGSRTWKVGDVTTKGLATAEPRFGAVMAVYAATLGVVVAATMKHQDQATPATIKRGPSRFLRRTVEHDDNDGGLTCLVGETLVRRRVMIKMKLDARDIHGKEVPAALIVTIERGSIGLESVWWQVKGH